MLKSIHGIADAMAVLSESPNSAPPPGASPLWGGQTAAVSGGGAPPRSSLAAAATAGQRLQPLSRRLLQVAGVLSILLILVVANSLLRSDENPFNPVAAAAEKTQNCPGFHFSAYIVYSTTALPQPITASGSGAYNAETKRTSMSLDLNSSITGPMHMNQVIDDQYIYENGDAVSKELPPGKEWVRINKEQEKDETPSADFDESLEMLDSSGDIHAVGRQSVNGKMTRRYRGEVPLDKFIELLREDGKDEAAETYEALEGTTPTGISAEVWIDSKKILRRMRVVMPVPGKEGEPSFTMDMRMDLFGFGAKPDIQLPDPDTVVDGPLDSGSSSSGQIS
jgi:hypothetical protein